MDAGKEAENHAASFLQSQGLRLVAKNYRCRMGEIDLIMEHGATLVFVEVRFRRNENFGGAAASITGHKQRKLIHAAQHYLQQQAKQPPCRFDALLLDGHKIEWIKDAFSA
ncbi:MAG: YraN family protein [Pseudomonadota bacterium]|jgi:putative endonuclease